jgi:hypothetical protein
VVKVTSVVSVAQRMTPTAPISEATKRLEQNIALCLYSPSATTVSA